MSVVGKPRTRPLHGALHGALVVAITLAALAFDPSAASSATPKIALVLVVALGVLAPALPTLWRQRPAPPTGALLLVALAGWSLVTLAWSAQADPTIPALWLAGGALALGVGRLDPDARRALAGRSATVVTAGASLIALAQHHGGAEGVAIHGAMGNPNWLGLTLACALPLVIGHAFRREGLERALTLVAGALGVAGLILAESRVAFVALAVVLAVTLAARFRTRRAFFAILIAAIPLALLAAHHWSEPLAGRLWLAELSLDAWTQAPLLGHGSGSFTSAFLDAQSVHLAPLPLEEAAHRYLFATTAHGDWLQLAVEGGVLAPALGLLLFVLAIIHPRTPRATAASLAVVALCMVGDAPLHQPAVVLLVALSLAETPALLHRSQPRRSQPLRRDALLAIATTVALAVLLPRATTQWLAERSAHAARDAEPAERLASLERASRMAPWWSAPAFERGITELELGRPHAALAAFDEAEAAGMVGPSLHLARGNALVTAGRPAEARASYEAALRLNPASFRAHANLAQAARLAGDLPKAERHLALATDLRPHHPKLAAIAESLRRSAIRAATSPSEAGPRDQVDALPYTRRPHAE